MDHLLNGCDPFWQTTHKWHSRWCPHLLSQLLYIMLTVDSCRFLLSILQWVTCMLMTFMIQLFCWWAGPLSIYGVSFFRTSLSNVSESPFSQFYKISAGFASWLWPTFWGLSIVHLLDYVCDLVVTFDSLCRLLNTSLTFLGLVSMTWNIFKLSLDLYPPLFSPLWSMLLYGSHGLL